MNDDSTIQHAITSIRHFIAAHPDCADTLEGIHRWWIRWPYQEESPMITMTALQRLESLGEVEQMHIAGNVIWRKKR